MKALPQLDERPSIEPRWLWPLLDFGLVVLAFVLGYIIRYDWQVFRPVFDPSSAEFAPYIPYMLIYAVMLYFNYQRSSLYRHVRGRAWMEEVTIVVNGVTTATVVLLALFFMLQPEVTSRLMLVYVALLTVALLSLARAARRAVLANLRQKGIGVQRVLIVGMGETGQTLLRSMIARSDLGYRVVGYLADEQHDESTTDFGRVPYLGSLDNLVQSIKQANVELVAVTLRWQHYSRIMHIASACRSLGVAVRVVPDIFQLNMRQVQVETLDGIPLLGINGHEPFMGTNRLLKRALDLSIILLFAPLWVPLLGVVALAIKLDDKGPIFYRALRVGENGREFYMLKFRSMIPDADKLRAQLIQQTGDDPKRPKIIDDPRVTRVGRVIRKLSLDELPNLINVLLGQMSLVGPRPPLPDEVAEYEAWHMQRLQIIPGITGLWQVSGRSDVPFAEMCLLDIYYIENWSVELDLQILAMTVPRVLTLRGAY